LTEARGQPAMIDEDEASKEDDEEQQEEEEQEEEEEEQQDLFNHKRRKLASSETPLPRRPILGSDLSGQIVSVPAVNDERRSSSTSSSSSPPRYTLGDKKQSLHEEVTDAAFQASATREGGDGRAQREEVVTDARVNEAFQHFVRARIARELRRAQQGPQMQAPRRLAQTSKANPPKPRADVAKQPANKARKSRQNNRPKPPADVAKQLAAAIKGPIGAAAATAAVSQGHIDARATATKVHGAGVVAQARYDCQIARMPFWGEPSAPPPPPSWPLPPRSAPRERNRLGDRLQFYWQHNTPLICMRYFPTNEFNNALTTIQLFPDVARQARYGSDQVGELPKELWDECKAVSGFWIRGMGRYCGRGFGVVGYGTNKKKHLRAVALAGAVAAAALSEPGLDWKQHSEMFLEFVKAVKIELGIASADPPAPAGFQVDVGGWDV
jgi:hypothetical protein